MERPNRATLLYIVRRRELSLSDDKQIVADLQQHNLQIDFVEMKLVQNSLPNPISYRGTGYIRQTEDDTLALKLYSAEMENTDVSAGLRDYGRVKPGVIYDDADFYTLTAT